MTIKISRGIRNNNPGNIRWEDEWQGLVNKDRRTDKAFCQFVSPEYGIRAMIIILRNYSIKHGITTISGIINRWAPPSENDTLMYISSVTKSMGIAPEQRIDIFDSQVAIKLLQAIILHENHSQPYDFNMFVRAIHLADGKR